MREWLFVALAATSLACSGGRDPVHTVGGDHEYPGPGAGDPYGEGSDNGSATTSISALVVLCTKACAHIHDADCEGSPKHDTGVCEAQCEPEVSSFSVSCADEAAAVYACTIDADITCAGGLQDEVVVDGCETEESDLQKCEVPGSDCVPSPEPETVCLDLGFSTFVICSDGVAPPPGCIQIGGSAFCC